MPQPTGDRWAHRRGEPRTFAAFWIAFLLLAVLVSIGAGGAFGLIAVDTYRPAARAILVIAAAGVCVVWPMVRLSQLPPACPALAMLQDVIVVSVPLQALTWPQALPWMAGWGWEVVGALSVLFAVWSVVLGGFLAVWLGRGWPGWVGMVVVLALIAAGVSLGVSGPPVRMFASAPTGVLALTTHTLAQTGVPAAYWAAMGGVLAAGACLWGVAAASRGVRMAPETDDFRK